MIVTSCAASAPASLTIISCKYENRQRLQFTTEYAKRQTRKKISTVLFAKFVPTLSKQSKVQHNMGAGYAFLPIKQVTQNLTLKVVSESRVTWATSVPILVFLGLSVLDLGPMYATDDRQTSDKSIT